MKLPDGYSWTKCASVTYGGKQHFYHARTAKGNAWFIWNRLILKWELSVQE